MQVTYSRTGQKLRSCDDDDGGGGSCSEAGRLRVCGLKVRGLVWKFRSPGDSHTTMTRSIYGGSRSGERRTTNEAM